MDDKQKPQEVTAFQPAGMADAFLLCTPSGRVRYASGGLKQMVEEDLTGRNLNDFLADDQTAWLIAESAAGKSCSFRCQIHGLLFRCETQPGEHYSGIQIELFPVNLPGKKGRSLHISRLTAREVNNSLAVLMPAVQLIEENARPDQRQYLAVVQLHLFRLLRMSRNLEDMALAENGSLRLSLRDEDLTDLCRNLMERVKPYCQTMGIDLQVSLPQQPVQCWTDREKVQRMLLNLIANAIEAQRQGGAIRITLRQRESDTVVFSVTDQGGGISGELMGKLTQDGMEDDPKAQTGLGLGLALTRIFAEAHGGQLMLMSGEHGGLSAQIVLPRGEAPSREVDQLHTWRTAYGAGIDLVKVELSTAVGRTLFSSERESRQTDQPMEKA